MRRRFRGTILLSLFIYCVTTVSAQQYTFEWTKGCAQAFEEIQKLHLDRAAKLLAEEKSRFPNHLTIDYLEDYIFFYRYFITEDLEGFNQLPTRTKTTLNRLERGPEDSPEYRQYQAEVLIHSALIRGKFESFFPAAQEINRAFKLLKKNERDFPNHLPTRRMISTIRAGVGTLPKKYKWIVKLLSSLSGSVQEGLDGLTSVIDESKDDPSFVYHWESKMLYSLVLTHFANQPEKAYDEIESLVSLIDDVPLIRFAFVNAAQGIGQNDEVIRLLNTYSAEPGQLPVHYFSYILGVSKLYRGDADADGPLLNYVNAFKGRNYIKEAYQKLAWHELMKENLTGYRTFMHLVSTKGVAVTDEDKQAGREAEQGIVPHAQILRARLYFDGGYYRKAINRLNEIDQEGLSFGERLELNYRLGRVYQQTQSLAKALGAYNQTIQKGKDTRYYYPCNAALQSGIIYEELKMYRQARIFYEVCLEMSPDTYQNSLHQKAKAGLDRIKGKS